MRKADILTDKSLEELEEALSELYEGAYEEMKAKADEYFEHYNNERWIAEWEAWQRGDYTDAEFHAWEQAQLMRGQRFEEMRDALANRMVSANEVASVYINDGTAGIFVLNHNYSVFEIARGFGGSWTIYDEDTIRNLMREDKNVLEFRVVRTNPIRDYVWNRELISKALASGIVQGKPITEIAESFLKVMERNKTSAMRNARTAYTSAQNAGRLQSFKEASEMGVNVKKQWKSCRDGRVRDSHAHLDGQIRPYTEPFSNGLMFPGDSSGEPSEVYNCRCTMEAVLPDYMDEVDSSDYDKWIKTQRELYG